MRTLLAPRICWKALLVTLSLLFALPPRAEAQSKTPAKTQTKKKAKKKTKAQPQAPAQQPEKAQAPEPQKPQPQEPEKAPSQEPAKAEAPEKAPAPEKVAAPRKTPPPQKAPPAQKAPAPEKVAVPDRPQSQVQAEERARAASRMRIGVGLDLFTEDARMAGQQSINASQRDESFDYKSATFLSATLSLSIPAPIVEDRARIGGGVRLFGNYSAGGDRRFGFGLLNQAFVLGEYGLPVADKTEVMFGGRAGVSLLIPGRDFDQEIERLQVQGVGVWSVPRVGWLAGLSAGARRRMSEHILLRTDLSAQLDKLYLFSTSETIEGLEFSKSWSTFGLRLGLTLGIEFAL
jgi:outer membrane biosynthesis protein TonB